MVNPMNMKQVKIGKEIAHCLGWLKGPFESGELKEEDVENANDTHFVINMDNGVTMCLIYDHTVKYGDVVFGSEPITMMARITSRPRAAIQSPFLIFKNNSRSYPIRGAPYSVSGVNYRSSPKGWMHSKVWCQLLTERRAFLAHSGPSKRTLVVDNCSSQIESNEIMLHVNAIQTFLKTLPPNATEYVQSANSFVIQKIKECW